MELKDFEIAAIAKEKDFDKLLSVAKEIIEEQDEHIKYLQEELEDTKTESVQALQKQNERLTETIKQIDMALDACFGIKHTDFQNHMDMIDALRGYAKIKLPQEPIGAAEYLIAATRGVKATPWDNLRQGLAGEEQTEMIVEDMYSCSNLRQIAEHLLVYCNAHSEED